jgi:hypothetical protein
VFNEKNDTGLTGAVGSVIAPSVLKNSWLPFFEEYRSAITKSENQIEQIRVVIEF